MHRRLSDELVFSPEQVKSAQAGLKAANIESAVRQVLSNALGTYLHQPSFPKRLSRLLADVAPAAPNLVPQPKAWRDAVVSARNGFAHGLGSGQMTETQILQYHHLGESLHWLLALRLLIWAGVEVEKLGTKLQDNQRFQSWLTTAAKAYPEVFAKPA
jgi:hypothetical protein